MVQLLSLAMGAAEFTTYFRIVRNNVGDRSRTYTARCLRHQNDVINLAKLQARQRDIAWSSKGRKDLVVTKTDIAIADQQLAYVRP